MTLYIYTIHIQPKLKHNKIKKGRIIVKWQNPGRMNFLSNHMAYGHHSTWELEAENRRPGRRPGRPACSQRASKVETVRIW